MIHTGKTIHQSDYNAAKQICDKFNIPLPAMHELPTGGYVGKVTIVDVVTESCSPWFFGPIGFKLAYPSVVPFTPALGKLNIYNIS